MIYGDVSCELEDNLRRALGWPTSVGLQVQRVTSQFIVFVLQGRDEAQLPTTGYLPDKCPRHGNESQNKPFTLVVVKRYF